MNSFNYKKLLRSMLSLVMVLSLLLSCGLMFAGCNDTSDDNDDDSNNYEGLSDAEYMQKLELNNLGGLVDALTALYGAMLKTSPDSADYSADIDMSVQLGDMILDMLEESFNASTGETMDFSFLSSVDLNVDLNVHNKLQQMDMAIGLGGQKILTASTVMSLTEFTTWVGFPELSNKYGEMNIWENMNINAGVSSDMMDMSYAFLGSLPSEKEFNTLIKKYIGVALKELKNVEKDEITLELDGLEQKVNQLTVKINEADALNMVKAILNTAKDDNDLEKIIDKVNDGINNLMKQAAKENGGSWQNVDIYAMLKEAIEAALDELDIPADELDTETYLELITYVDDSHNIIGRKFNLELMGVGEVYYYTVTEGKNFAFEAVVQPASLRVVGSGTNKSNVIDAEYTFNLSGSDLLILSLKDWADSDNSVKGTIKLEPTAELISLIFGSSNGLPFADVALELKLDCKDSSGNVELNLLANDAKVVGFSVAYKPGNGGTVKVPTNTFDFTNQSQLQSWVEGMDFDAFFNNLRKAGVPGDLVDTLESYLFGG